MLPPPARRRKPQPNPGTASVDAPCSDFFAIDPGDIGIDRFSDPLFDVGKGLLNQPGSDGNRDERPLSPVVVVVEAGFADCDVHLATVPFTQPTEALALLLQ